VEGSVDVEANTDGLFPLMGCVDSCRNLEVLRRVGVMAARIGQTSKLFQWLIVIPFFFLILGITGDWLLEQLEDGVMSSHSLVYEFLVSKVSVRRVLGDGCNMVRDIRA